jgi:hypothetical protein
LSCPIEANLTTILTALTGALAHEPGKARIAVLAYFNPFSGIPNPLADPTNVALLGTDGTIDCSASGPAIGLNDIIACTGRLFGASLADAYPLFQGHALQLVLPGDVHPNNAGYGVLARLFIHALSR